MFSIIIKKNKNDKRPYGLNKVLKEYIRSYGSDDIIIASPGYQSTTQKTIAEFCKELKIIAPANTIYFALGMNGSTIINGTGKSIHDHHVPTIRSRTFGTTDHSKFILFLDRDLRAGNCNVKAAALGSSNLSRNTYCLENAPKGETDILLIKESVVNGPEGFRDFMNAVREDDYVTNNNMHDAVRSRMIFSQSIEDGYSDEEKMNILFPDLDLNEIITDLRTDP